MERAKEYCETVTSKTEPISNWWSQVKEIHTVFARKKRNAKIISVDGRDLKKNSHCWQNW